MKIIQLLFLLITIPMLLFSQNGRADVVATAGDSYRGANVQLDWTMGELAISRISGQRQITQGFHQPYYHIVGVDELPKHIGQVKLFPNPTSDRIQIQIDFEVPRAVVLQLVDLQGRLLWTYKAMGQNLSKGISLSYFPSGFYLLNVIVDDNQYQQTYKIEKTEN